MPPTATDSGQVAAPLTSEGATLNSAEPRLRYLDAAPPPAGTTREIAPGIHWLRMPLPIDLNHINLWLIEDGPGFTLIDTGFPVESCTAVWQSLEPTLLRTRPLSRILLTHYHPDHMGCAAWLQQRCGVPVRMAARALPAAQFMVDGLSGERRDSTVRYFTAHGMSDARGYFEALAELNRKSALRLMPEVVQPLSAGECVSAGNWQFKVIETDGHAVAHQSFYSAVPALLISGDQILPTISPNISLAASDWGHDPLGDYLVSLDLLAQLPAETLVLPSHGRPFRGLHERIADLRDHHVRDLALLRERIAVASSAFELLPALYGRQLSGFNTYLGLHECIAHLEHLVRRAEAVRETAPDGTHRYRRR